LKIFNYFEDCPVKFLKFYFSLHFSQFLFHWKNWQYVFGNFQFFDKLSVHFSTFPIFWKFVSTYLNFFKINQTFEKFYIFRKFVSTNIKSLIFLKKWSAYFSKMFMFWIIFVISIFFKGVKRYFFWNIPHYNFENLKLFEKFDCTVFKISRFKKIDKRFFITFYISNHPISTVFQKKIRFSKKFSLQFRKF